MTDITRRICLIGAGPIGIEMAIALRQSQLEYIHLEKRQVAQTIWWYPPQTRFFSSRDRIAIAGLPVPVPSGESRATREEYLAYLRSVVEAHDLPIETYSRVVGVRKVVDEFVVTREDTLTSARSVIRCQQVIFATGDMHGPKLLDIPGEELPHVTHYFQDAHPYFRRKLLIVGGRNSAVEAAIKCHHGGADVTLSYRGAEFPRDSIKYWLSPELEGLIAAGKIRTLMGSVPVKIEPGRVKFERCGAGEAEGFEEDFDFVLLQTGYVAKTELYEEVGVELQGPGRVPVLHPDTMESSVPGVYVAGTATAGSQGDYRVFIENSHIHVERIVAHLLGRQAPEAQRANARLES